MHPDPTYHDTHKEPCYHCLEDLADVGTCHCMFQPCAHRVARQVVTLFEAIKHGDEKHQAWLKEALVAHFSGGQVPPLP